MGARRDPSAKHKATHYFILVFGMMGTSRWKASSEDPVVQTVQDTTCWSLLPLQWFRSSNHLSSRKLCVQLFVVNLRPMSHVRQKNKKHVLLSNGMRYGNTTTQHILDHLGPASPFLGLPGPSELPNWSMKSTTASTHILLVGSEEISKYVFLLILP